MSVIRKILDYDLFPEQPVFSLYCCGCYIFLGEFDWIIYSLMNGSFTTKQISLVQSSWWFRLISLF